MIPIHQESTTAPLSRSWSAPARLASSILSDCLARTREISGRVTRLTGKALEEKERQRKENLLLDLHVLDQASTGRSRSLVDIRSLDIHSVTISEDILTEVVGMAAMDQSQVKKRTCHQCHAPTSDPCHDGVPSGVGVCPLQHWGLCAGGIKGGVDKSGKSWAGCTDKEEVDDSDTSVDSTLSKNSLVYGGDDDESNPVVEDEISFKAPEEQPVPPKVSTLKDAEEDDIDKGDDELDSDEEALQADLQRKRVEIQELQGLVQQKADEESKRARDERRRNRLVKAEAERADLERQERTLQAQARGFSAAGAASVVATLASGVGHSATGTRKKTLDTQVAEHEARRQRRAADKLEKRKSEQAKAAGLSMATIRQVPEV